MTRFDTTRVPRRSMTPLSVTVETSVWKWLDVTYHTYSMGKGELVERALCKFLPNQLIPEGSVEALPSDYFDEEEVGEVPVAVPVAMITEKGEEVDFTDKAYYQLLELETLTGININVVLEEAIDHFYLETMRNKAEQEAQKEIELPKPLVLGTVEDKLAALISSKNKKVEKELIGLHLSAKVCKLLREFKKATDVDMSDTVEAAVLLILKDFAETLD